MLLASLLGLAVSATAADQTPPPEVQMALTSFRSGERERLEQALGDVGALPLYRADLEFDPRTRIVTGKVLITLTAKKKRLDEIFLRSTPNANLENAVKLGSARVNGTPVPIEQPDASLFRVGLPSPIPIGGSVTLEVKVASKVPAAEGGSDTLPTDPEQMEERGGDYGAYSVTPEVSCLAGIIPMVPFVRPNGELAAGPTGIGDLGTFDPSHFVVSVVVPRGYTVVAPGEKIGEVPENEKMRFTYAVAAARELPILVTKGYDVAMSTVGEITVESHFSGRDAKQGKAVLEYANHALKAAQEKLGPYPYKRFRVVQAHLSNGAGGMEFPGLITVATTLYRGASNPMSVLGMPDLTSNPLLAPMVAQMMGAMLNDTLEFTVDHEVAHQYIAMLVGSDPVEEPVADEPLTQAIAMLIMEWEHKPELANSIRNSQVKTAFQMMRMMNHPDAKANRPTSEFTSNVDYAGLIYGKAALLFDAQRKLVGTFAFERALKTYVDENRYKWVTAKTFTTLLARQNSLQSVAIEKLRRRWWEEKHGDEDIGGFDLESMMEGLTAGQGGTPASVDPQLLQRYNDAMDALMKE